MALLAQVINGFWDKPENVATRALYHIVTSHPTARRALAAMAASFGAPVPAGLRFQLQQRDSEHGQPDLVAVDEKNRIVLVVEAKFWAGLTEHLPARYISLLPTDRTGTLLFLAPAERISALLVQRADRCSRAGHCTAPGVAEGLFSVGPHAVSVISWGKVLSRLVEVARHEGDELAVPDNLQLLAL
jgi:hypothetical protein